MGQGGIQAEAVEMGRPRWCLEEGSEPSPSRDRKERASGGGAGEEAEESTAAAAAAARWTGGR